jgi:hypothetical protein
LLFSGNGIGGILRSKLNWNSTNNYIYWLTLCSKIKYV